MDPESNARPSIRGYRSGMPASSTQQIAIPRPASGSASRSSRILALGLVIAGSIATGSALAGPRGSGPPNASPRTRPARRRWRRGIDGVAIIDLHARPSGPTDPRRAGRWTRHGRPSPAVGTPRDPPPRGLASSRSWRPPSALPILVRELLATTTPGWPWTSGSSTRRRPFHPGDPGRHRRDPAGDATTPSPQRFPPTAPWSRGPTRRSPRRPGTSICRRFRAIHPRRDRVPPHRRNPGPCP